jgi:serine/threonine protein kinase
MTERFTLLAKIGRGGMGVVWRARDEETGQIVALKLLHSAYADDPEYVTRFERELELARRIKSPNVVGVIGYGVREGTPYLALEYVDGPSLRERLASHGPYSWSETKALLTQIAKGLADAHAAGVVHRDIKPSNILIGSDGVAKIADFGIARGLDLTRVTGTSTLLGTPAYLPPEGPQDERSDLYSLGIVAYELLAGVPPFEGSTYAEVLMAHVRVPPDLDRLPVEARPIVGWLLAKEPKDRPQSADELIGVIESRQAVPVVPVPLSAATQVLPSHTRVMGPAAGLEIALGGTPPATRPQQLPPALAPGTQHRLQSRSRGQMATLSGFALVGVLLVVASAVLYTSSPYNPGPSRTMIATPANATVGATDGSYPSVGPGGDVSSGPVETVLGITAAPDSVTRAPVITPTRAPVVTPTGAPVITPTRAPVITPTAAPVITPTRAPVITPTAAPVITPTAAPVITPTPVGSPPAPPTTVVTSSAGLSGQVAVYWQDDANDFIGFHVYGWTGSASGNGPPPVTVGPEYRSYVEWEGVGVPRCFDVAAFNTWGESAWIWGGCATAQ